MILPVSVLFVCSQISRTIHQMSMKLKVNIGYMSRTDSFLDSTQSKPQLIDLTQYKDELFKLTAIGLKLYLVVVETH